MKSTNLYDNYQSFFTLLYFTLNFNHQINDPNIAIIQGYRIYPGVSTYWIFPASFKNLMDIKVSTNSVQITKYLQSPL